MTPHTKNQTAKWFTDEAARRTHLRAQELLSRFVAEMCPGYELSHMGINRNNETNEVQIRLHLNPIGSVRVVPEHKLLEL